MVERDGAGAVHVEREARGSSPVGTMHRQRRAVGNVVKNIATSLVHRIVGSQFALISRKAFLVSLDNFIGQESLNPQSRLQHIAFVSMTEFQGCGACVGRCRRDVAARLGHILCACIEPHLVGNIVVSHHHAGKGCQRFEGTGVDSVVVDGAIQPVPVAIGFQTERDAAVLGSMSKKFLRAVRDGCIRLDHHIDGERFGGQHTGDGTCCLATGSTVEVDRRRGGYS